MFKRMLVASCVLCLLASVAHAQDDKKKDDSKKKKKRPSINAKRLIGEWEYASGKRGGEDITKERLMGTIKITKDTFTLPAGPDENFVMAYKIDATKTPAEINLEIKSGPVSEGMAKGIIKMQRGQVVFCYDPTGGDRPTEFKSTEKNGAHMFTMKRKLSEAEKKKKAKKKKKKKDDG